MAAERACELSEKPARVVRTSSQQASLLVLVELDPEVDAEENADRLEGALAAIATGGVAAAARDDAQGRFRKGDAVGFADGEIVAWGGAGSTLAATVERLAEGCGDRHRDLRRGGADPARGGRRTRTRRGRDREARGRPAELVVAARGPVAVRSFAGERELARAELLTAPVHWPRPAVLEAGSPRSKGVGPKTAEAAPKPASDGRRPSLRSPAPSRSHRSRGGGRARGTRPPSRSR